MTGQLTDALLLVIVAQLALLTALAVWAWWDITHGSRAAWIADAHSGTVEHDEAIELLGKDMHETLSELERLLTRIADAADESAQATREGHRR